MNKKISEIQSIGRQHRVPAEPDIEPTVYDMHISGDGIREQVDQDILEEIHDQAVVDQEPSGD